MATGIDVTRESALFWALTVPAFLIFPCGLELITTLLPSRSSIPSHLLLFLFTSTGTCSSAPLRISVPSSDDIFSTSSKVPDDWAETGLLKAEPGRCVGALPLLRILFGTGVLVGCLRLACTEGEIAWACQLLPTLFRALSACAESRIFASSCLRNSSVPRIG